jgi:hypothetical protein
MQTDPTGSQADQSSDPAFGLWMPDRWVVWMQLAMGAFLALLIVPPVLATHPTSVDKVVGVVGALVVGLLLGVSERDMRWRRMVSLHVDAVHAGMAVPNSSGMTTKP